MALTVGCDPEFILTHNGSHVNCNINHTDKYGNIGSDHGGRVGELRPKHGKPAEVAANLKGLLAYIHSQYPQHKVVCGGGAGSPNNPSYEAIGGHIHFGGLSLNSAYESSTRWRNRYRSRGRGRRGSSASYSDTPDGKLIKALDFFIGRRLKKVSGGSRPRSSSYGRISDIETKTYGFEYRTPPSWITDPYLAEAVLAVAYRIAEMWNTKPDAFDVLFQARKTTARRKDYNMLIPPTGANKAYYTEQLKRFRRVAFSKTYQLDNPECIELWMNPQKLMPIYSKRVSTATEGSITRRVSSVIQLQVCQIKQIDRDQDFEQEAVIKVCRFALPEIRIYPFAEYTPWQFQLTRDIRLRPDTIYFSKELRPYLKMKRGGKFRTRFMEIKRRTSSANGTQIEALENCVFYNAERSADGIAEAVTEIFETCARTKIRREVDAD